MDKVVVATTAGMVLLVVVVVKAVVVVIIVVLARRDSVVAVETKANVFMIGLTQGKEYYKANNKLGTVDGSCKNEVNEQSSLLFSLFLERSVFRGPDVNGGGRFERTSVRHPPGLAPTDVKGAILPVRKRPNQQFLLPM